MSDGQTPTGKEADSSAADVFSAAAANSTDDAPGSESRVGQESSAWSEHGQAPTMSAAEATPTPPTMSEHAQAPTWSASQTTPTSPVWSEQKQPPVQPVVESTPPNRFTPIAPHFAPPTSSPAPRRLGTVVVVALVSGLLGGGIGAQFFRDAGSSLNPDTVLNNVGGDSASRPAASVAGVARRILPTVVSVETNSPDGSGNGSGAVIQSSGSQSYILTNNHVVLDVVTSGGTISVRLQSGDRYAASVVGRDPSYDLAVLRVNKGGLPVIPLGDSTKVVVGDGVIAIGSPLGLTGTVTSGIVSALRRPVTTNPTNSADETSFISAIQTDAAINPGNSGGPLVDAAGRMIGVNSAIATLGQEFTGQSGNIGVGFAIPINQARRVAQQIIRTGGSTFPVIGVQLDRMYTGDGARIAMVEQSGPARAAGLRVGDVITRVDGRLMTDATDVITTIRSYAPGDVISITVRRGSAERNVTVTLGSRPSL